MTLLRLARALAAVALMVASSAVTISLAQADITPRPEEWWFDSWQVQQKLWPVSRGRGVIVGLLDSGVNASLPELSGVVLPGTDFQGGDDRVDGDTELGGHGTGMAALIAGQGGGSGRMVGLAPDAKILPVYDQGGAPEEGPAIRYAVDHGAKVINMSFGSFADGQGCLKDEMSSISYAIRNDVVLIAAAGNDGAVSNAPSDPAMCPGVVAVGGVDDSGHAWEKTSPGYYLALAAPAVRTGSIGKAGVFSLANGTSSAAALTTALVALVRAKYPTMSGREVVRELIDTAQPFGYTGWNNRTGYGVVRATPIFEGKVPPTGPNPVYERFERWLASGRPDYPDESTTFSQSPTAQPPSSHPAKSGSVASGKSSTGLLFPVLGATTLMIALAATVVWMRSGRRGRLSAGADQHGPSTSRPGPWN